MPDRFTSTPIATAASHRSTHIQISHFGMIFTSSRNNIRSFFLRKRINLMRSLNASLMLSSFSKFLSLIDHSSTQASFRLLWLLHALAGQRCPRGDHWRYAPPQRKTSLQQQFRRANGLAEPFNSMPYPRSGRNAQRPRNRGNRPHEFSCRFFFAKFFSAHAHPELRAAGETRRHLQIHGAQSGKRFPEVLPFGRAGFAFGEVRLEPLLVLGGKGFHVLLGD